MSYTLIELRLVEKMQRPHFVVQVLSLIHTLDRPLEKENLGTIMWLLRDMKHLEREGVVNRILAQIHHHTKDVHYGIGDLMEMLQTKGELGYFTKKKERLQHAHKKEQGSSKGSPRHAQ